MTDWESGSLAANRRDGPERSGGRAGEWLGSELRQMPLWMLLTSSYLFVTLALTVMRESAVRGGALVEGSAAGGTASHLMTWFVVALVGAVMMLLRGRRGLLAAGVVGSLFALLSAIWELDALSAPASSSPRHSIAWLFLLGVAVAPLLGAGIVLGVRQLSRRRRGTSR